MISIRLCTAGDVPSLAIIEGDCFQDGYSDKMMSKEDFAASAKSDTEKIIVAEFDDILAGYALLVVDFTSNQGFFDSLAVSPVCQGKGIGSELFKAIEGESRRLNLGRLNLEIKEDNYALLKRYHQFGYKCFSIKEGFYQDGSGAILMYKTL